jgi:hypothetical protein
LLDHQGLISTSILKYDQLSSHHWYLVLGIVRVHLPGSEEYEAAQEVKTAEQPEEQTAAQPEAQTGEWPEEQTAEQLEEQTAEQPEVERQREARHHQWIHHRLITDVWVEDGCLDDQGESRNWNSRIPLKSKNRRNSMEMPEITLIPGGYLSRPV